MPLIGTSLCEPFQDPVRTTAKANGVDKEEDSYGESPNFTKVLLSELWPWALEALSKDAATLLQAELHCLLPPSLGTDLYVTPAKNRSMSLNGFRMIPQRQGVESRHPLLARAEGFLWLTLSSPGLEAKAKISLSGEVAIELFHETQGTGAAATDAAVRLAFVGAPSKRVEWEWATEEPPSTDNEGCLMVEHAVSRAARSTLALPHGCVLGERALVAADPTASLCVLRVAKIEVCELKLEVRFDAGGILVCRGPGGEEWIVPLPTADEDDRLTIRGSSQGAGGFVIDTRWPAGLSIELHAAGAFMCSCWISVEQLAVCGSVTADLHDAEGCLHGQLSVETDWFQASGKVSNSIAAPPGLESHGILHMVHVEAEFATPVAAGEILWLALEGVEGPEGRCCHHHRTPGVLVGGRTACPRAKDADLVSARKLLDVLVKTNAMNNVSSRLVKDQTGLATSVLLAACRSACQSGAAKKDAAQSASVVPLTGISWAALLLPQSAVSGSCILRATIWRQTPNTASGSCDPEVIGTTVMDVDPGASTTIVKEVLGQGPLASVRFRTEFRALQALEADAVWQKLFCP